MHMKLNNPFVLAGYKGPTYFCDRVKETKRICDAIKNESNVTLISPRRYGKTGLIRNAFYKLEHDGEYETIYVDVFGAQNLADFIMKYRLRAASSVKSSLKMLLDKELVYHGSEGYVVYDRFFAEYLRSLV